MGIALAGVTALWAMGATALHQNFLQEKSSEKWHFSERSQRERSQTSLSHGQIQVGVLPSTRWTGLLEKKPALGGVHQGSACLWHINWAEEVTLLGNFLRIKFTAQSDKHVASKTQAVYRKRQSCL